MVKTRVWVLAVVTAVVAIVVGCQSRIPQHYTYDRGLSAVALRGGRPVVMLTECSHYPIVVVSIGAISRPDGEPDLDPGWTIRRPAGAAIPAMTPALGDAPAGWTGPGPGAPAALEPGYTYRLAASDEADAKGQNPKDLDFTLADLNEIGFDQVLVGSMHDFKVISEEQFRAEAKQDCWY